MVPRSGRERLWQRFSLTLAVVIFIVSRASLAGAAEIGCNLVYDGKPFAADFVKQVWPDGFLPVAGMCKWAYLRGTIEKGDYERFRVFYRNNSKTLSVIQLLSPGGDVGEALLIGRLLRRYLITAMAPARFINDPTSPEREGRHLGGGDDGMLCWGSECICASACALIWFGAVERNGFVGLHRPRIDDPAFKILPAADAAKVYRRVLDDIAQYLGEMETPRPMIDVMVATGSSEIRWIDADTEGVKSPPSYAEWISASCGYFTAKEEETYSNLAAHEEGNRTTSERLLYNLLAEKSTAVDACKMRLRFSMAEQLAPP